ncbi:hypothetical protein [Sphingomonas pokkalii]|uniref:Uncharacterized protein n=1 Tax=Sphingomonas pokkalii TaxID=2175090 RepID=A0A2U0SCX6_9SPHN|nr:hypothetical protein [Sphingomonas pokkalii]PVX29170.1 hypothetical protein DD559_07360 [Sphingomonas pokkalii]
MLLKQDDYLMDFSECLARHESILRGLLEYKSRRDVVLTLMPPPQMVNGQIVSFLPTRQQMLELPPHLIPLGTMVVSSRQLSSANVEILTRLCKEFKPMMIKHFPGLNIHSISMEPTA